MKNRIDDAYIYIQASLDLALANLLQNSLFSVLSAITRDSEEKSAARGMLDSCAKLLL